MLRVLMIKNRRNELEAMASVLKGGLYPNDFIPLVEIINEKDYVNRVTDLETGEIIALAKSPSKNRAKQCIMDFPHMECDATLHSINRLFKNRTVLIEFFRCNLDLYKNYSPTKNQLVLELNLSHSKYRDRILRTTQFETLVPVIAVKSGIDNLSPKDLASLVKELRMARPEKAIAIRIDEIEGYEDTLTQVLTPKDYLFFDISEQPFASKETEYEEVMALEISSSRVLICSPRKRDIDIKDYEHNEYTRLIDNFGAYKFKDFSFDGYGDYGGLKDSLPRGGGGRAGRALALLYCGKRHAFKSYVCDDKTLGFAGYQRIIPAILSDRTELDPDGNCFVYKELEARNLSGAGFTYQDWVQYTLIRCIQQIAEE